MSSNDRAAPPLGLAKTLQAAQDAQRRSIARRTNALAVTIGGGPACPFRPKAPARPKINSYEGDWQKLDGVEGAANGVGEGMEIKVAM